MAGERESPKVDQAIEGMDESKRATLKRLVTGTAFVAPVVAAFAMDGLSIPKALAANGTGSGMVQVQPN